MRFFRRGSNRAETQGEFKPKDLERSLVDPWINDIGIPFIGSEEEKGLRDLIMEAEGIDKDRKPLILAWAQRQRGQRMRPGGERTDI
ncbi:hypothetical protein A3J17_01410 [Candidatus Curtissbacteria bacterium RIFCSPLOWO2_02_FULL_40_11]|uniref:Uncharacterized protein n=1 Tax=Candidatus Curtissbacteria bacterium RIFCSPHIGHO2_02_FULL_40_16b TaxID=1797714 RepID=A0A1F5G9G9_9BACT|nr:MAG: hypothetical protein A3D04_03815 [Candidatus Curtissbacteria bacterium RIFCSPHIGHO2_02_FULL_40_16b]OGE00312.1 MAG: hypothetical protein A3J17_01410 [Candidatus Curtissbacteria bacterium RIFCSPLOWO2_02_FULL_40_11]